MDWAPAVALSPEIGDETGELRVIDSTRVEWRKNNSLHRVYPMEQAVRAAVFAHYAHSADPEELWVVVVLEDQTVHSFATRTGHLKIMGLNLKPKSVFSCGRIGVVFTTVVGKQLLVNILEGPEELLQAVVSSSIMEPLRCDQDLVFMDENVAVVWSGPSSSVMVFSVRMLRHNTRSGSSAGSDVSTHIISDGIGGYISAYSSRSGALAPSETRAAVLSPLCEWPQQNVGKVFTQELVAGEHEFNNWLVAVHDPQAQNLFVLSGMDLVSHDRVEMVAPIKGIHGVPMAALLIDGWLQLHTLFSPQSVALGLPFENNGGAISRIDSESDKNWVKLHFSGSGLPMQCISLYDDFSLEISTCFDIICEVLGVEGMSNFIRSFLIQLPQSLSNWDAFRKAFHKMVLQLPPSVVSQLIYHMHMLREELSLFESHAIAKAELFALISPYVQDWSQEWTFVYPSTEDNAIRLDLPCNLRPPSVFESLIHNFDTTVGEPLPEFMGQEQFYPYSYLLNRIFQMISTVSWSESMARRVKNLLLEGKVIENLDNFDFSIQACILQVKQLIHWDDDSGKSNNNDVGLTARELFPADLRFDEAQRCLQIKEPQQCVYGTLVDPDRFSAQVIMLAQPRWSRALGERALATAYGRAAVDMGRLTPLLWDQITAPPVDFSGVCMETGITIPTIIKNFSTAAKYDPWGTFAHGVSLGLSISRSARGVDSLWVMTSAKLKAESQELYSGFVYGMGLSGHLKSLEDWQFYESLVNTDKYGTLAALVGVAASKLGSRDAKLTKVFSVHIRALLPKGMNVQHFVAPDVEHGALVALGLLYFGTGVRHISDKLLRQLEFANDSTKHVYDGNDMENNEVYKFALGMSLGLINCGRGSTNHLDSLVSIIVAPHDESVASLERVNGTIVALICAFLGSNNARVAEQLRYTPSNISVEYVVPTTFFGRALALHLILWDSIGRSKDWVVQQCSVFCVEDELLSLSESEPTESTKGLTDLNYFFWKAGVLVAMAMRYTGTNDEAVVNIICDQIGEVFLPLYIGNISRLLKSRRFDQRVVNANDSRHGQRPGPKDQDHTDFLRTQFVKSLAQILSHLVLAVSAVAAGTGNLRIMRLLRQMWQVTPQFQAFATFDDPQATDEDTHYAVELSLPDISIDLTMVAQSFGWLFMSHGQRSFKTDHVSIALLTCASFVQILGGANVDANNWRYVRFLWSLVTEQRCLFANHNPSECVHVEVVMKSGESRRTNLPTLLPPFSQIDRINIMDEKFMLTTISELSESKLLDGIRLTPRVNHSAGLDIMLKKLQQQQQQQQMRIQRHEQEREQAENERSGAGSRHDQRSVSQGGSDLMGEDDIGHPLACSTAPLRAVLEDMARHPQSYQDQLERTLLLSFYRHARPVRDTAGVFSDQWLEQTQLKSWLSQQSL